MSSDRANNVTGTAITLPAPATEAGLREAKQPARDMFGVRWCTWIECECTACVEGREAKPWPTS